MPNSEPCLLKMSGITKNFPGVKALAGATFSLKSGEVHALVGENGAGKSTLIKILTGVHRHDNGIIELRGENVAFDSPQQAQAARIATIYQEFTLVPSLSVRANLFLGREKTSGGFINSFAERSQAREILQRLGVNIDPETTVSTLTIAQQQLVEIGRALASNAEILVMDEPTAALTPTEVQLLFEILRSLTAQGTGIIFISHRLDEVFSIADRITVLRDGATIETRPTSGYTRQQLIEQMVGRTIANEYPRTKSEMHPTGLEIRNVSGGPLRDISFLARRGEILGIAGLMGAGRTELVRLIFGADKRASGEIRLDGKHLQVDSPRSAIAQGICLLNEDRKAQGLVLCASAKDNFALPNLASWSQFGFINAAKEGARFREHVQNLKIKVSDPGQLAINLSGGNQQKLLVARWLETNSQVVIFDEPTRGIDVGAKYEMYLLIGELAAKGKVVIVVSSELPELLGICDRILVLRRGRLAGEIADARSAHQEDVMSLAV
jgi:ribose transport system ATP-binding protein